MMSLMNIDFSLEKFHSFVENTFGYMKGMDESMIESMIQLHDTYATCRVMKQNVCVEVTSNGTVKFVSDSKIREICNVYTVYLTGNHEYTGMIFNLYDISNLNIGKKFHAELIVAPTGETKITKKYALPESSNDHAEFLIQPLHDASVVTLYYNFGKLHAASSKSINILENYLFDKDTFRELFSEIVDFRTEFTQDKCPCVVAFKHPNLQPREQYKSYHILERQIRHDADTITTEVYTGSIVDSIPETLPSEYGFVIRDNSGYTIYENELFQFMKKTYYSMSTNIIRNVSYKFKCSGANIRRGLLLLRALCNRHSLNKFKTTFPSLVESLDKLQNVLNTRVSEVHTYCRTGSSTSYNVTNMGNAIGKLYTSASIDTVRDFMYDKSNFVDLAIMMGENNLSKV